MDRVNTNYIFLITTVATQQQVTDVFRQTFCKYNVATRFKVSVVINKDGYCGYSYVWVEDQIVFRQLTGMGEDGQIRVRKILDPTWRKPQHSYEDALAWFNEQHPENTSGRGSWADEMAREDALTELEERYTRPMLDVPENPIIELVKYRYNDEQLMTFQKRAIDDGSDPDSVPLEGAFIVSPSYVPKNKYMLKQHVLCCSRVPEWVTPEQLKHMFSLYASDSHTVHKKTVNKHETSSTYPFVAVVERHNHRMAYITFDENKIDGRMALLVCRKLRVIEPPSDPRSLIGGRVETLIFNHSKANTNDNQTRT